MRVNIKALAQQHGKDNLLFLVPMRPMRRMGIGVVSFGFTSSSDPTILVPCRIEERWNREVDKEYKLILKPIEQYQEAFGEDDVYTGDLQQLIESGHYQVFVQQKGA